MSLISVAVLAAAVVIPGAAIREATAAAAVLGFGLGSSIMAGSWFPLLRPLIPEHLRGRFFGFLRFAWQLVGVAVLGVCAWILSLDDSAVTYALILAAIVVGQVVRLAIYVRIPELSKPDPEPGSLRHAIGETLRWPAFTPLTAYVFLLALTTGGAGLCFTMIETGHLNLADGTVVVLGNLTLVGGVVGFLLAGWVIDRWGSRIVFVVGHLAAGGVMAAFVLRGVSPVPTVVWLGAAHVGIGLILSGISVAVTTEQMQVLPPRGRGVALALAGTATMGGGALAGLLVAALASSGMLNPSWQLAGSTLGTYDAILVLLAGAVIALVVTLGLVPSVIGSSRAQLIPEG